MKSLRFTAIALLFTALTIPTFASKDVATGVGAAAKGTAVFVEHPALLKKAAKGVKGLSKASFVVGKGISKGAYKTTKRILF